MKEDITERRNLSFWYLSEFNTPEYRKNVRNYLKEKEGDLERIGFGHLIIDLYDFNRIENKLPTGHIYLLDLEDKENKFEEFCRYILSKDRRIIPEGIKCKNKEDYGMIEKILKENYGERGKLKNPFWVYGRTIKVKNQK